MFCPPISTVKLRNNFFFFLFSQNVMLSCVFFIFYFPVRPFRWLHFDLFLFLFFLGVVSIFGFVLSFFCRFSSTSAFLILFFFVGSLRLWTSALGDFIFKVLSWWKARVALTSSILV